MNLTQNVLRERVQALQALLNARVVGRMDLCEVMLVGRYIMAAERQLHKALEILNNVESCGQLLDGQVLPANSEIGH